ncbi:MAG: site-specific DNA-methyltransferase [Vicinamibacteria bacterium]|nr:site-specific DNA-methyltransferase [Vicinamibacteria bacterium]
MNRNRLALLGEEAAECVRQSEVASFVEELRGFTWDGKPTVEETTTAAFDGQPIAVPQLVNEFWTSRQRAAHSLHEISYRACFKPQLPRFFIERLTAPGDRVFDPFSGRGTTALEAALLGRLPVACDINPLSRMLLEPRLSPPSLPEIIERLHEIAWSSEADTTDDLLVFYHPDTLRQISALRGYFFRREASGDLDRIDRWLRMVAVNRLTGHSPGFFSVYTLPPNQAVSLDAQAKINVQRGQTPPQRDVARLIVGKSKSLLRDLDEQARRGLARVGSAAQLVTRPAASTPEISSESVDLVVTSPPFLDVVDYAGDNWLRGWFCGIDPNKVQITMAKRPEQWHDAMRDVFLELFRILRPGRFVAFEVGEVRGGKIRLEEIVVPSAMGAGFEPRVVLVNSQQFTKTANCWGVANNRKGTNTNRIVLLQKPNA